LSGGSIKKSANGDFAVAKGEKGNRFFLGNIAFLILKMMIVYKNQNFLSFLFEHADD